MALVYRNPFEQLQRELDRMIGTAFGDEPGLTTGVYPPVNVFDAGDAYVVKAEVPGVDASHIEVEVQEDALTLRGERVFSEPAAEAAFHRRERPEGQFRRVVRLPGHVASSEIKADLRDGVLTVRLPKAEEARPRKVAIQAG